jgi:hypothetical protein
MNDEGYLKRQSGEEEAATNLNVPARGSIGQRTRPEVAS